MKCTLTRPMDQKNPEYDHSARVAAKAAGIDYDVPKLFPVPAGTEIEHADAWKLVMMGVAEPSDEECEAAVVKALARRGKTLSKEELALRAAKYERLNSGRATGDKTVDAAPPEGTAEADDDEE